MSNHITSVAIATISEVSNEPMTFDIYESGVGFGAQYSVEELTIAHAVLMDLADAIAKKIMYMKN